MSSLSSSLISITTPPANPNPSPKTLNSQTLLISLPNTLHKTLSKTLISKPNHFKFYPILKSSPESYNETEDNPEAELAEIEEEEEETEFESDYDDDDDDEEDEPESPEAGKLYVGNLPYAITSSELSQIVYDRVTDRSRGFAFITMASVQEAKEAIRMFNGSQIGGRTVKVNFPEVPRGGEREVMGPKIRRSNKDFIESPHKIYAGNLSWIITSERLKDAFADQPGLLSAKVIYEKHSGRSRGFGFVTFSSPEAAESALSSMNGMEVEGRALRLNLAAGKEETSRSPRSERNSEINVDESEILSSGPSTNSLGTRIRSRTRGRERRDDINVFSRLSHRRKSVHERLSDTYSGPSRTDSREPSHGRGHSHRGHSHIRERFQTEDMLPWLGNANMTLDLRPTEDVLPWPGNANMALDLRPTEDVLPWPGNANMALDLRPTEDVLPWPGNANMAFDLVPDLQCLLRIFYIRRYLRDMHEDNYNGIVIPL
ncbi:33 kDa ribonucleoprotein, chloroplastic [Tanacetum coccineum]|uniref:33 kDa ribonucleoprotein, chloroplastic n=1 Tax=Tanacetum coccineum TaxID=301880 RepID=A0ABQ4YNV8_9ASTR